MLSGKKEENRRNEFPKYLDIGPIQRSIANGDFGVVVVGSGGSMVPASCRAEKSPKCKVMQNGKKNDKTEEPKEPKNSLMQRRTSPRFHAKQNVDTELIVCRRIELLDSRDDAVDVKKSTLSKTSANQQIVGKEQVVGEQHGVKNLDETTEERKEFKESSVQKRTSPRFKTKQKVEKELPVGRRLELPDDRDDAGDGEKKSNCCKRSCNHKNVGKEQAMGEQQRANNLDELTTEEPKESKESSVQRRTSSRVQAKQKVDKELLVRRRVELLEDRDDAGNGKKSKRSKQSCNNVNVGKKEAVSEQRDAKELEESTLHNGKLTLAGSELVIDSGNVAGNLVDKSDFAKVKETLRLFNKHYLHFVQEEEKRCRKVEADSKVSKKGSKSKMLENNETLYPEKRIGNIPGIKVGHQFYSRAEMVIVGFHSHWLNGIDYMGQSYCKTYSDYVFPIAVAIVLSGMYEDDLDNAEDVVYTGQGGHNLNGDKRQIRDQVLERGNLALKNCVEQQIPVRVVRGHESSSSYSGKVYTYDGLYKVVFQYVT
ncbi:histone-lysine N-methyltransferase, H3 lysine-9 specific SUVH4 isoform X1 [Senna tora]|uniref:Histone-lysine N-methyltransferase, H3 lysine-9 specific SUVH4 isoform X1 n=1 Tax=Senna tora TaxID=362788 RepID=A0A834W2H5_9FABA|nr:histone-lysine N-methyltransferase, H3 lysine-9 specific SUVH4 isoform X1 [Senna tora]